MSVNDPVSIYRGCPACGVTFDILKARSRRLLPDRDEDAEYEIRCPECGRWQHEDWYTTDSPKAAT